VPNDPQSPFVTSGIRIGTPAATTRGFGVREVTALASWICDLLDHIGDAATIERVRRDAEALCARFPVYGSTTASGPQRHAAATA
jgi:glycine hydroxymethyltransferase